MRKYLTEFLGTMFLVLIVCCAAQAAGNMAPIAIGFGLMSLVYMGGPSSGAHYNPAVTLAAMVLRKMPIVEGLGYMLTQVLGAMAGAGAGYLLTTSTFAPDVNPNASVLAILLAEFLFTFMLVLVVLCVAAVKRVDGNSYYGLAIGLTVTAAAYSVGGISGGAFNPAVALGTLGIHSIIDQGNISHVWYYLVGPLAGGLAGAGVFRALHPPALNAA